MSDILLNQLRLFVIPNSASYVRYTPKSDTFIRHPKLCILFQIYSWISYVYSSSQTLHLISDILLNQLRLFVISNSASYVRYTPESDTFIRHPKLCILFQIYSWISYVYSSSQTLHLISDILLNQLRLFVISNSASYFRYTPKSVTYIRHPKLCILFQIYSWISYVYSSSQTLHLISDILLNQLRLFVIPNSASYFRYTPKSVTYICHLKLCILFQIYSWISYVYSSSQTLHLISDILLNQLRIFVIPNSASYFRYTPKSVTFICHLKLCILFQIYSWISYVYSSSQTLHLISDILLNQLRLFVIPNSASYFRYTPKSVTYIRHPNSASYFRYTPESVTYIRHPKLCILFQIYSWISYVYSSSQTLHLISDILLNQLRLFVIPNSASYFRYTPESVTFIRHPKLCILCQIYS